jgi:predicted nucleotidyltransferase
MFAAMDSDVDRDATTARLTAALACRPVPGVVSAYMFGSLAEGRAHRESDLDLGVLFDRACHPDQRARFDAQLALRARLSPAVVGREIDLVVLNDAPPLLGRRIARGLCVYCADAEQDHAFRRDVQLRAADLAPFIERMRRRLLAHLTP